MTLTLRSPAFEPGTAIPARFDHERGDRSPALGWDGVPEGTAGLILLVDDPLAPVEGSFVHWVLCNLDRARQGIAEGEVPAEATAGQRFWAAGLPGVAATLLFSADAEGYTWLDGALGVWEGEFDAEQHTASFRAFVQTPAHQKGQ